MKVRYKPGKPCCKKCVVGSDDFNRANGPIDGSQWETTPAGKWSIVGNELEVVYDSIGTAFDAKWKSAPPHHLSVSVKVKMPADGRIRLRLFMPNLYTFDVELRQHANATGFGDCGSIAIFDHTNSIIGVGGLVPVPGVEAGAWHKLTLCYDIDTKLLSTHVTLANGSICPTHARDVVIDPFASQVWLLPTGLVTGTYYFDDFLVEETHIEGNYGYEPGNDCPCCGPQGCWTVTTTSRDGDCRWQIGSGSWDDFSTSSTGARLNWIGSWSGIDKDCLPDLAMVAIEASFVATANGAQVVLLSGSGPTVTATIESSEGAGDGTIAISSGETVTDVKLKANTGITIRLCWDGLTLAGAVVGGEVAEGVSDVPPTGRPSIGTGDNGGTITFTSVSIGLGDCEDTCFDFDEPDAACDICIGGTVKSVAIIKVSGLEDLPDDPCQPDPVCKLINSTTFLVKSGNNCEWAYDPPLCLGFTGTIPPGPEGCHMYFFHCENDPFDELAQVHVNVGAALVVEGGRYKMIGIISMSGSGVLCSPRAIHFAGDLGPATDALDCNAHLDKGVTMSVVDVSNGCVVSEVNSGGLCGFGLEYYTNVKMTVSARIG